MNVGELKRAIAGVADDVKVTIFLPENCKPHVEADYMRYVKNAKFSQGGQISGPEVTFEAGEGFGY